MPELPEVETIRRDLEGLLVGKKIERLEVNDHAVLTGISSQGRPRRKVSVQEFRRNVLGRKIQGFFRRGKYLIMKFSDGTSLIFHLRMTGQIILSRPEGRERLWMAFDDGKTLCFADRRRFGEIFCSRDWEKEPALSSLGIEPLNGKLTASFLKKIFKGRKAPVHSLLLNQKVISGLGNIYATESLFQSGILPARPAGRISEERLRKLACAIRSVLEKSIQNRGYSMNTYVDALGRKGRSQLFTAAYGKEGEACPLCGKPLKRKALAGRSAVHCGNCQK
jgi:formamidopyrimidine-DNA glycosylase